MSPTLTITYTLHPPSSASIPPNLSPTTTHAFPVHVKPSESESPADTRKPQVESLSSHYAALREAIAQAKDVTGSDLTAWRDAVGDGEKEKAGGKGEVDEEEDEEVPDGEEAT